VTASEDAIVRGIMEANYDAVQRGRLSLWTLFDHPVDFPTTYVARRSEVAQTPVITTDFITGELDELRRYMMKAGLTCITRSPQDHPNIVEVWL
jgi:hypothetical protein